MKDNIDPEQPIAALWCWDSETSEKCLINLITGKILYRLPRNNKDISSNKPSIINCNHNVIWFDRCISLRKNGKEGMAYICNDCGDEV